jgi:hypothetical protein
VRRDGPPTRTVDRSLDRGPVIHGSLHCGFFRACQWGASLMEVFIRWLTASSQQVSARWLKLGAFAAVRACLAVSFDGTSTNDPRPNAG